MDQIKIGKFISRCRKSKKMTQEEFAENLGVNSRTVSRWENGQNMPDFSLYDPICEQLDISINELLSGEKVNKEEYQEKFEKNIIEVVNKVDKNNKRNNIILNIIAGVILFICVCFVSYAFYCSFEFEQKYDENKMKVTEQINSNDLTFKTKECGNFKYIIMNRENDGLIFITFLQTLEDKNIAFRQFKHNFIDLTTDDYVGHSINIEGSNLKNNYKVYYTNSSFSKIAKANNKELNNIIKKSSLIYEKK